MNVLLALLGAMLLFGIQQVLYSRFWMKKLTVGLSFSAETVTEGDTVTLCETVVNKKWLPLPIVKVKFMTSKTFSFSDTDPSRVTDHTYRCDLLSVLMYQKLTRSLPFTCTHRGYFTVTAVDIVSSDLFVTTNLVAHLPADIHLYVYPQTLESDEFQAVFKKMLGTVITKRFINEDPFEFRGIREYQPFDELKAVNWKASAKTDSLKVNVHDCTVSQQVRILLNLKTGIVSRYEELQEESIRLAATFALAFINRGVPVSLCTNALDVETGGALSVPAGSGVNHQRTMLETLARADATREIPAFAPTVKEELIRANGSDVLIVISSDQNEELQMHLSSAESELIWVVPYYSGMRLSVKEELTPFTVLWRIG